MSEKARNQKYLTILIIAVIAIAIVGIAYTQSKASGWIWTETTNSPTATPTQAPYVTPAPTQPSPTQAPNPNPTPTATFNPIMSPQPTPTSTSPPQPTATIWQALYVTDSYGNYWVTPATPYHALGIVAYDNAASNWEQTSNIQNNIYMNINLGSLNVVSWTVYATETITIDAATGSSHTIGGSLGTLASQGVSGSGGAYASNTNVWCTGASSPSSSLESSINKITTFAPGYYCYFVVQLSNVQITLNLNNGQSWTLAQTGSTPANTLAWLIELT
jgi:hypothetical protein